MRKSQFSYLKTAIKMSLVAVLLSISLPINGRNNSPGFSYYGTTGSIRFTENVGQAGKDLRGGFFAEATGIQFHLGKEQIIHSIRTEDGIRRVTLHFDGATTTDIMGENAFQDPFIFIGKGEQKGKSATNFARLRYRNLYPGIDLLVYAADGAMKYDFLLKAGANPYLIRMRYVGANGLELAKDGSIVVQHADGKIIEGKPVVYSTDGHRAIASAYEIKDGIIGFQMAAYDPSEAITIDPPHQWSLTYGGSGTDFIKGIAQDSSGNVIISGYTASLNFPRTISTNAGTNYDMFIVKFDGAGNRLWSLQYGGAGNDFASDIAVDATGNIFLAGKTSGSGIRLTDSTYRGVGDDAFLAKFTPSGALLWATQYGGAGIDGANSIATTPNGDVYMVGQAASGFPVSLGGFAGSSDDAFLVKFNSAGSRLWSMVYGGSSFDYGNGVASDLAGNVAVTGETGSLNFPVTSTTFQGSGGVKAFVLLFDANGVRQWGMKYGGSNVERGRSVAFDREGNLVVAGFTSSSNFPATITTWQGGAVDAFLLKLSSNSSRQWAFRYGGSNDDMAYDVAVDTAGAIFLAGETGSGDFPQNFNNHSSTGIDGFWLKFKANGSRVWGGRYGGSSNDYAYAIAAHGSQFSFAGHTQSTNFPQTIPTWAGTGTEGIAVKFQDCINMKAQFSFGDPCNGRAVTFTDQSAPGTSPIISWAWDFGDGATSNIQNPSHLYAAVGTYQVQLVTGNECGIKDTATALLRVFPNPVAAFTVADTCHQAAAQFTNGSWVDPQFGSVISVNQWKFGDGATDSTLHASHLYANPTSYLVKLNVISDHGCQDSIQRLVYIRPKPVAEFAAANVCQFSPRIFSDSTTVSAGSPQSWNWSFGNGATGNTQFPSYAYPVAGTYPVSLVSTTNYGCKDTVSHSLTVYPKPVAAFPNARACDPYAVQFADSSSILTGAIQHWNWAFGDANADTVQHPAHVYAITGGYNVTLIVSSDFACRDTATGTAMVYNSPIAGYAHEDFCFEMGSAANVAFSDSSSIANDQITIWAWNFGDGQSGTQQSPAHTYSAQGTYTCTLVVASANDCADTVAHTVRVYPKPEANFMQSMICQVDTVHFADSSLIVPDSLVSWAWDFGDGASDTVANPDHHYAQPGSFNVSLAVVTNNACADTIVQTMNVYPSPIAAITALDVCEPDAALIIDNTTLVGDSVTVRNWDFGDGTSGNLAQELHPYAQPGSYPVHLSITSSHGCTDTASAIIHLFPKPVSQFTLNDHCKGDTLRPVQSSFVLNDTLTAWDWGFGNGGTSAQIAPAYVYTADGNYTVNLIVTTANGCRDTSAMTVTVFALPVASFEAPSQCDLDTIAFTSTSQSADPIVQFHYQFGDGQGAALATTQHLYGQAGTYLATLAVETTHGCRDDSAVSVVVYALPQPQIAADGPLDICIGSAVGLSVSQSWATYAWSNGNGDSHIMVADTGGLYWIEVTDTHSCKSKDSVLVHFHNVPKPNALILPASWVEVCAGETTTLDAGAGYSSYNWSSGETSQQIVVDSAGQFSVIVYNGVGCVDTSNVATVEILPLPAMPTIAQQGDTLVASAGFAYQWFRNGNAILGAMGQQLLPFAIGQYQVRVTDTNGCTSISMSFEVTQPLSSPSAHSAMVELLVYPNPTADWLHVGISVVKKGVMSMRLIDTYGRLMLASDKVLQPGAVVEEIDLRDFPAGYWMLSIDFEGETSHFKVLKINR